ncbi:expressed unknown protein [Seminavis robusta]|uniref:Uncharacterized protein n=1 Tax=Seminavis robusta TaxID=568900 RepID=A0A9N8DBK0_9STRA|nr:expressed unknown protein [Seminavis robusta]|eukprot:Sro77_g041980.1 n/a (267) ;mRNA; f:47748-48548
MGKIIESQATPILMVPPMGLELEVEPMLRVTEHNSNAVTLKKKSSSRCPSSRKVSFAESDSSNSVKVQIHFYDKECDEETIRQSWYNHQEYAAIKEGSFSIMREMKRRMAQCGHDYCPQEDYPEDHQWTWRGFEYVLQRYPRKHMRLTHSDNVLHFQQVLERSCPTALADYTANSSSACGSGDRARQLGINDQQTALEIYSQSPMLPEYQNFFDDEDEEEKEEDDDSNSVLVENSNHTVSSCRVQAEQANHLPVVWRTVRKFFLCI